MQTAEQTSCPSCSSHLPALADDFDPEGQFAIVPLDLCPGCSKLLCPACGRFTCDECGMTLCADHLVSVWIEGEEMFAHVCTACDERTRQFEFDFVRKAAGRESSRPAVVQIAA